VLDLSFEYASRKAFPKPEAAPETKIVGMSID
jgi:hypothetical protein